MDSGNHINTEETVLLSESGGLLQPSDTVFEHSQPQWGWLGQRLNIGNGGLSKELRIMATVQKLYKHSIGTEAVESFKQWAKQVCLVHTLEAVHCLDSWEVTPQSLSIVFYNYDL